MENSKNALLKDRSSIDSVKMQCKVARDMISNLSSFIWANDLPIEINLEYKLEHPFGQELFEDLGGVKLK